LSQENLKRIEIRLPPLPTQQQIASILSAYDELIENNTRRIKILEEIAQSIYREWFVNFRYPEHEKAKMVDSPLGMIPEGWGVKHIGEIAKVKGGKRLPKGRIIQDEVTNHPYLRVVDFADSGLDRSSIKYIDEETHLSISRYVISNTDIYISIAGTIGRVGSIPNDLSSANLTENAAKICEIQSSVSKHYLLHFLHSDNGQAQIASKTVGTSQPKLALFRIQEVMLAIPPTHLIHQSEAIFSDYSNMMENLRTRNITICQTRDLLLPRLISGEIDVTDLDIQVPEELSQ